MALLVGAGAGLGAAAFRWLIFAVTWLTTGHQQFGQQGHAASVHLPWLGIWFVLVVPVLGGLIYGPVVQRFAREARGHGVPEVMLAVAENGGRIRPPVTIVKAFASAICIGTGGSVGREGPIVQIGSAFASTVGQLVHMSKDRLRIIVACGAAGGIAATFNAPITGLFFGFEIVLREFSLDALFATSLAAVTGDVVSRAFFGSAPFFTQIPHGLFVANDSTYLLVALLGICAGLVGVGFKTFLYKLEDFGDQLWKGRPEWARPAVGGLALGALLLVVPQMYGVGYPVMDRVIAGHEVLALILLFMLAKILASSLTLSIGGSGGVFAPSLFTGAMAGMAFGIIVQHAFGGAVGPPALYAVVAMGGVFAATAQAPLTAIASVVEMTGNFGLTLPIMLASGIAAALSKQITYGSIYTTKLLRRGVDIERAQPTDALRTLTAAEVMQPVSGLDQVGSRLGLLDAVGADDEVTGREPWHALDGLLADARPAQALFVDEPLEQALQQLVRHGHTGLPVVSHEGRLEGWITRQNMLRTVAESLSSSATTIEPRAVAGLAAGDPQPLPHEPNPPLAGHAIVELTVRPNSPALGQRVSELSWPAGSCLVAITRGGEVIPVRDDSRLTAGESVILLAPTIANDDDSRADAADNRPRAAGAD
ncbi:MAG TPA: chloride channel protein [Solirubrobacteraceae bacterium]|nr:chloride channel protein [Solirubrobacteraceae bacterium]